jgi:hypothetical protein
VSRTPANAIALAAATLMQSALSVATDMSSDSRAKPNSFVPHAHTNTHVYGAPIQPAIVGHAKTSHHKHTPKKRSSSARDLRIAVDAATCSQGRRATLTSGNPLARRSTRDVARRFIY